MGSNGHIGINHSKEWNDAISRARKGHPVSAETREKQKAANIGKKYPDRKTRKPVGGWVLSPEVRAKWSTLRKGRLGQPKSEETKQKLREIAARHRVGQRRPPTSIEAEVLRVLSTIGIAFEFQAEVGPYHPDFLISDRKLIIEADGVYWHSLAKVQHRDHCRDSYFRNHGYKVVHLPEREIWADPVAAVMRALATE